MSSSAILNVLQVGAGRASAAADLPAPLAALLDGAAAPDAAERLWLEFGALDLWQRAGFVPPAAQPSIEASPADEGQPCPPSAQRVLRILLQGEFRHLLPEWLELAQRGGHRLPPRFLPQLLDHGSSWPELRAAIAQVLGRRGAWLAARNPEWSWAVQANEDHAALFDSGTLDERVRALRGLRRLDPAAALALLAAGWNAEPPEQRAALLPCLSTGLSRTDEAFLEAALDDRRKEVRGAAASLLGTLDGSAYLARARARAGALLAIGRNLVGMKTLTVTLPQERDKAAQRDGIGAVAHTGLGEKAGWLAEMLSMVPPRQWSDTWALAPEQCLELAAGSEFEEAIVAGWTAATQRRLPIDGAAIAGWYHALARRWREAPDPLRRRYPRHFFSASVHLPAQERERFLLELLAHERTRNGASHATLLLKDLVMSGPRPLSPGVSQALMAQVRHAVGSWTGHDWEFASALPTFAAAIDPRALADIDAGWPTASATWEQWDKPIGEFLRILRFRQDMTSSFQESV